MMNTNFQGRDVMFQVTYGSKLYGTSTSKSDTDLKSIYLPALDDLLLGKKLVATKSRVDANGVPVPEGQSMPDGGVENEYIPFQTFVRDFVNGQTYAVECAYAILKDGPNSQWASDLVEFNMVKDMITRFGNNEVYSMVGFAMKQTFDYVKRGERLNEALKVFNTLNRIFQDMFGADEHVRLDTLTPSGYRVLDYVSEKTGLPMSTVTNNNKVLRTLELNGRSYTETTSVLHLLGQLQKLIKSYGDRTNAAAVHDIDFKSLSHAVRVYQQAIELLDTGVVTFPRSNAADLLQIKNGSVDLEEVKMLLVALDDEVHRKMETSTVRKKTSALIDSAEQWLLEALQELYGLGSNA